jgi:hypothetical protein
MFTPRQTTNMLTFPLSTLLKSINPQDPKTLCDAHKEAWWWLTGVRFEDVPGWDHPRTLDNYDIEQKDLLENLLLGLQEVARACRLAGIPVT